MARCDCLRTRWVSGACQTCGMNVGPVAHIPTMLPGVFCCICCPACNDAGHVVEAAVGVEPQPSAEKGRTGL